MILNDSKTSLVVRVPGKIMLTGEYDVLFQGGKSLAFTTDRYLSVKISSSNNQNYHLSSSIWKYRFSSNFLVKTTDITKNIYKKSVYELIHYFKLPPINIDIKSQLDPKVGMGSSSAMLLGLTFALYIWSQGKGLNKISWNQRLISALTKKAYELQVAHQSMASGYDMITQLSGGLIEYCQDLQSWPGTKLNHIFDNKRFKENIHLFKGGKGAPTKIVLPKTYDWLKKTKQLDLLKEKSRDLISAFISFVSKDKSSCCPKKNLFEAIGNHRKIFEPSPFFPHNIQRKLATIDTLDTTWSYKTTGAGGEDTLLFCGAKHEIAKASKILKEINWEGYDYHISNCGLHYSTFDAKGNKRAYSII